jgi:hypothetical protein
MNFLELKAKPIWQMTGEDFLFLLKEENNLKSTSPMVIDTTDKKYVYGIRGIAQIFNASIPTANRIKKSGIIDKAITQWGRKIVVDANLAIALAGKREGGKKC